MDGLELYQRMWSRPIGPRVFTFSGGKHSPWNIALWLRYVHGHAKRSMFRFRHGPFLDTANSFETTTVWAK